jgi:hypothetical protein
MAQNHQVTVFLADLANLAGINRDFIPLIDSRFAFAVNHKSLIVNRKS